MSYKLQEMQNRLYSIKKVLLNPNKKILNNIQLDLLNKYNNISQIELDMLSSNIYDYCSLVVNKTPKQKILDYISCKNRCYYDNLSNEDKEKLITIDYKTLIELKTKYVKLLNTVT